MRTTEFYVVQSDLPGGQLRQFLLRQTAVAYALGVNDGAPGTRITMTGRSILGTVLWTLVFDQSIGDFVSEPTIDPAVIPTRCLSFHEGMRCELFESHDGEHFNNHNATTWKV